MDTNELTDAFEEKAVVPAENQAQELNNVVSEENSDTVTFEDLGLDEYTLKAIERKGFVTPSPIQVLAIPRLLNGDTNLIARARTGTGKTAAFGLPIIQSIREKSDNVQALILEPTRELAMQTCEEMKSFSEGDLPRTTVLYGGASYVNQIRELKRGCEIVVGTPGRIKDHLERKTLDLSKIKYFILDEGDEMLDMGFIDDIREIFEQANQDARILLFSATMPAPILKIAADFMGEYDIIEEEKVIDEALLIDQKYWLVKESEKIEALVRLIDMSPDFYGIVFTMTKM
nr:DEAD/DEAH box helicase [Treponema sp.]